MVIQHALSTESGAMNVDLRGEVSHAGHSRPIQRKRMLTERSGVLMIVSVDGWLSRALVRVARFGVVAFDYLRLVRPSGTDLDGSNHLLHTDQLQSQLARAKWECSPSATVSHPTRYGHPKYDKLCTDTGLRHLSTPPSVVPTPLTQTSRMPLG